MHGVVPIIPSVGTPGCAWVVPIIATAAPVVAMAVIEAVVGLSVTVNFTRLLILFDLVVRQHLVTFKTN